MKAIFDLKNQLHSGLWALTPEAHASLKASVEKVSADWPNPEDEQEPISPANDEDEPEEDQLGSTVVYNVNGILVKGLGLPEEIMQFLGLCDIDDIAEDLTEVAADANVTTVVLNFNTPGGSILGLYETGRLISELAQNKQVIGYTSGLCCSAGYWLASKCQEFYCSPSSIVGSIGIVCERVDVSQALKDQGISCTFIASDPRKAWGNPELPLTDDEKADIQSRVQKSADLFRAEVLKGRKIDESLLHAQIFDGMEAASNGFADYNFNTLQDLLKNISEKE